MAKTQTKEAGADEPQATPDPMLAVLGELGKTMKAIQTQNDTKLAMPAEGLFEAPVKGGRYLVGGILVDCEGEPIEGDKPSDES